VSPVIPAGISVYGWSYRPVARYDRLYKDINIFRFFWNGVRSKIRCGIFVENIGMDLSHESTKNFDPLLIVWGPILKKNQKGKTTLPRSSELHL
jgi:hypothetical protein